jgi:three-Cys-motif partner protein
MLGDCNVLVDEVLKRIPSGSLGLAFVDPQGFEVNFDTLAKFAKRRIDLLYLFPSGIGVRRNLRNFMALSESRMDKWWGSKDWRQLPAAKQAAGEISTSDSQKIIGSLVPEYRQLLAAVGFKYQDEAVPLFTNTKNAQMYHLLFCSHSKAGLDIWKGIKRIAPSGQRGLWKE